MSIKKIAHIGIAVKDTQGAAKLFKDILEFKDIGEQTLQDMNLKIHKLEISGTIFELIQPLEGERTVSEFLNKRGEGIHHICFEVDDINMVCQILQAKGYHTVWEKPRQGASGYLVNFIHPSKTHGVLIELAQKL